MVQIYNIMARLCSHIIEFCDEDFFIKFSCLTKAENARINTLIIENLPELFFGMENTDIPKNISGQEEICFFKNEQVTDGFCKRLKVFAENVLRKNDENCALRLIQDLDAALKNVIREKLLRLQQENFSELLNTNEQYTKVGIVPRCNCFWERKGRLRQNYNRIDNYLQNILLIDYVILDNFKDRHIFLNEKLLTRFIDEKVLNIAVSPLKNCRDLDASYFEKDNVQYFKIEYYNRRVDEDNQLVWDKIVAAGKEYTDIIVFPEMLGNAKMEEFICNKLKNVKQNQIDKIPSIIILPSYWNNYNNVVTILDKYGNCICKQGKQYQYRFDLEKSGILEGIFPDRIINIIHCEGIGRMAVLVCKDFITTKYLEKLIKCFKLTLIVVPSFSTGSYDFKQALGLCAQSDCNVIWINTCAAMREGKKDNFKNIGYIRKRVSRYDNESEQLYSIARCDFDGKGICSRKCLYLDKMRGV